MPYLLTQKPKLIMEPFLISLSLLRLKQIIVLSLKLLYMEGQSTLSSHTAVSSIPKSAMVKQYYSQGFVEKVLFKFQEIGLN